MVLKDLNLLTLALRSVKLAKKRAFANHFLGTCGVYIYRGLGKKYPLNISKLSNGEFVYEAQQVNKLKSEHAEVIRQLEVEAYSLMRSTGPHLRPKPLGYTTACCLASLWRCTSRSRGAAKFAQQNGSFRGAM